MFYNTGLLWITNVKSSMNVENTKDNNNYYCQSNIETIQIEVIQIQNWKILKNLMIKHTKFINCYCRFLNLCNLNLASDFMEILFLNFLSVYQIGKLVAIPEPITTGAKRSKIYPTWITGDLYNHNGQL